MTMYLDDISLFLPAGEAWLSSLAAAGMLSRRLNEGRATEDALVFTLFCRPFNREGCATYRQQVCLAFSVQAGEGYHAHPSLQVFSPPFC
jgi:hypothetical protein